MNSDEQQQPTNDQTETTCTTPILSLVPDLPDDSAESTSTPTTPATPPTPEEVQPILSRQVRRAQERQAMKAREHAMTEAKQQASAAAKEQAKAIGLTSQDHALLKKPQGGWTVKEQQDFNTGVVRDLQEMANRVMHNARSLSMQREILLGLQVVSDEIRGMVGITDERARELYQIAIEKSQQAIRAQMEAMQAAQDAKQLDEANKWVKEHSFDHLDDKLVEKFEAKFPGLTMCADPADQTKMIISRKAAPDLATGAPTAPSPEASSSPEPDVAPPPDVIPGDMLTLDTGETVKVESIDADGTVTVEPIR